MAQEKDKVFKVFLVEPNTMGQFGTCKDCGWAVIDACCKDMGWGDNTEAYWAYCSNKACKNHEGTGYLQELPEWSY
jgi:hypothetical protein